MFHCIHAFNIHENIWSHDPGIALHKDDNNSLQTNFQSTCILQTNASTCEESPHYLARFVVCLPNVIKTFAFPKVISLGDDHNGIQF